ncbi:MAG: YdeI/OmpD-associated family protein [Bacteroidota bacterium]
MNQKADWYFTKDNKWQKEITRLRSIILDCDLIEEIKWGCPCYLFGKKNIVLIHVFKEYCAILFFKGALLKDAKNILVQQTGNVQATRQIRFTHLNEIEKLKGTIKKYIYEAVKLEELGLKVPMKKTKDFPMPEEFENKLNKNSGLKKAFHALTPGRQRGYLLYFSTAKQAATRESRIEKCIPDILNGQGLND